MAVQDEKKPPEGGVCEVLESWRVNLLSNNMVWLQRCNKQGTVIETYRHTTAARAAIDLVAIMQGCAPVRETLRCIGPIGPNGYRSPGS